MDIEFNFILRGISDEEMKVSIEKDISRMLGSSYDIPIYIISEEI